jgi:hypothetical protein
MDFAAPRTELSPGVRAREEVVRPMRGHMTYSHGGVDLQHSVETDVRNEVWMVVIARNLVRSLWSRGPVHAEEDHERQAALSHPGGR